MYLKLAFLVMLLACCVRADNDEGDEEKKGECPASTSIKCAEEKKCSGDKDCNGKKKCCQDACGKLQCKKPRPRQRKGKCPVEEYGICIIFEPQCTSDYDCNRNEKCCRNACGGKSCKPREPEKDEKNLFVCPAPDFCSSNGDCKGNRICCSNDCGFKTCQKPERNGKGKKECPTQTVIFPIHDQCEADDECPGRRRKCCPNECRVRSCKKTTKMDCSRVKCAEPHCGPDEIAYTPTKSCCQTCKRDCSMVKCLIPVCNFDEVRYLPEGSCCYQCKKDCSRVLCLLPVCKESEIAVVPKGGCCPICEKDCSRQLCPPLACEEGEVPVTPEEECCPICHEDCKGKQCYPVHCPPGYVKYTPDRKCCESCKPEQCQDDSKPLPDEYCGGIAGIRCPKPYICDSSNIPPEVADGTGICCEATCVDEETGFGYAAGEQFKKDCNTCWCSKDGLIVCTKIFCLPCIQEDGLVYPSGSVYKVQCNTCGCSNGIERCTLLACSGCESGYPVGQSCNSTDPDDSCPKDADCEQIGKNEFCCKQPTCDRALAFTYCSKDEECPERYYCQLDGGKEGPGFCCLDCRTVRCGEPDCKPGYVAYQPERECCKACKKDCSAITCPLNQCKYDEELFLPEGQCCSLCKKPTDCYDPEQDVIYQDGAEFWFRCNTCFCKEGAISCTEIACVNYCQTGLKPDPNDKCTINTDCSTEGNGCETSGFGEICCREPICSGSLSYTHCTFNSGCPLGFSCKFPKEEERGFCCPAKPCLHDGVWYETGATYYDECNGCHCTDGLAACTRIGCLANVCYLNGKPYEKDEHIPSNDPCESCHCDTSGEEPRIVCAIMDCAYCENGIKQEGKCCPYCPPL